MTTEPTAVLPPAAEPGRYRIALVCLGDIHRRLARRVLTMDASNRADPHYGDDEGFGHVLGIVRRTSAEIVRGLRGLPG